VTFLPVKGLEISRPRIFDQMRPDFFSLSEDDGVSMFFGFLWDGGRMDSAKDDGYSLSPISIGDVISPHGCFS